VGTLLITGGAGFIGSNLVRHVLDHTDERLVVVDKLAYSGNLLNLGRALESPRVVFVHADIADGPAMAQVLEGHRPSAIVNLAAETHVDRSIDSPKPFVDTNIVGTFVLLEAVRSFMRTLPDARRDLFRFVHVSTDEVYGTLGPAGAFSEETAYAPNSPYAASKAAADHLVRAYTRTYGLPGIITNCSNNYGPYQYPEKLIPLMILNAIEGRPLPIYGDGGQIRDWLHVDDHCGGLLLVLRKGQVGGKYNIGGGNERTNLDVVNRVCDELDLLLPPGSNPALKGVMSYRGLRAFVEDRPGHDRRYAIDATRIRRDLGWKPRVEFGAGIRATVQWYIEHRDWCREVLGGRYDRERLGLGDPRS
jgi:dTDP-glucose 4,6-dehydratase